MKTCILTHFFFFFLWIQYIQNHNDGARTTVAVLDLVLSFSPMVSALMLSSLFFVESANGSFDDRGEKEKN